MGTTTKVKVFALALISVCAVSNLSAQKKGIEGNGVIEKKEYSIPEYSEIIVKAPATIYYEEKADQPAYVRLEVDENLLAYMKVFVKDKKLTIEEGNTLTPTSFKVYTNSRSIISFSLQSFGNVYSQNAIHIKDLKIEMKGTGNIELDNIIGKSVSVNLSGTGAAKLKGAAENINLTIDKKGSGLIDTEGLAVENANCDLSGSGNIKISVTNKLEAKINGSGNITYIGVPRDMCYSLRGIGTVDKAVADTTKEGNTNQ